MAKTSAVEKNNRRLGMIKKYANKRAKLKAVIMDRDLPLEDRFQAQLQLDKLPKNSSKVRHRNRCNVTGRPRGYHRKLGVSRVALRELGNFGQIPGLKKSSW